MKKVLIVAHAFPPMNAIGALRPYGLAKYLPLFGWDPIIVTAANPNQVDNRYIVINAKDFDPINGFLSIINKKSVVSIKQQNIVNKKPSTSKFIEIIGDTFYRIFCIPDSKIFWAIQTQKKCHLLFSNYKIDAIITTSKPESACILGYTLKRKYHVPWIADFRDLWTQNHYYRWGRIRKFIERTIESKTLHSADIISTVSDPLKETIEQIHNRPKVVSILNGFDPDDHRESRCTSKKNKMSIIYTGSLYATKRDPTPLFKSIDRLHKRSLINLDDIEIQFYGPETLWLKELAKQHHLEKIITVHEKIPRAESLMLQVNAHILLLLTWDDESEKGVYTGKIFEYLNAERPILSIGTRNSVIDDILHYTNAGNHFTSTSDDDLDAILYSYYTEFKSTGKISYHGIKPRIEEFSQIEMAKKFSELLNEITAQKNT